MKILFLITGIFLSITYTSAQKAPTHQQWDQLLKKYVNAAGLVNYKGLLKEKTVLDGYLKTLSDNAPQDKWSEDEQKAYWINAYNAFTVSLVLQHYPIKSIKDIGDKIKIPFVNTPWDIKFITIGGKKYDLNNIEHGILRKKFSDPRIHFALVCASISCPKLRNESYTANRLNAQLDEAGKDFLNDKAKNNIRADKAEISKYFTWYKGDFTKNGSLATYINKFSNTKISDKTSISYIDYNWGLNEQK